MKIVVSGGTGFIGRALVAELCGAGHQVVVLTRKPGQPSFPNEQRVEWNARSAGPWWKDLRDAQAVVNLAGEPIADKRWTSARKRQLLDSRLSATRCLVDGLMAEATRPPVLISASGIGYYGVGGARALGEEAPLGQGFLADLSARWEAEGRDLTSSKAAELEQVGAYLLATWMRERSVTAAPWARRFDGRMLAALDRSLAALAARIEIPAALVARHPGVSAVGMQKLLEYFRERTARVQEMLLAPPESDDAHSRITRAFTRIHRCVFPAFGIGRQAGLQALVTLEWLRGMPLPRIIRKRLERRARDRDPEIPADDLPQVIRETMQLVEEVARFRAPRYLSCYLDVLDLHLEQIGRADLRRDDLRFDLYLEFGVATTTLLSLVGLGLSRTSAVALSGLIARDDLSPDGCIDWVVRNRADLRRTDLPAAIRREIEQRLRSPVETGGNE